jgi:GntR family galactonate operon transcriptional repressor
MSAPQSTKLHEIVASRLCREIVSGRLVPGTPLPAELKLVEDYSVSKTVVRETMQLLAAAGLVRIQHGKRTTVQSADQWDVLNRLVQEGLRDEGFAGELVNELYEVRKVVEPKAAEWAAERAAPERRANILHIVDQMGESSSDVDHLLELDLDFHLAIGAAAGNRVLAAILQSCHEVLRLNWTLTDPGEEALQAIVDHHRLIAEAIGRGDGPAAREAMSTHLEWAVEQDRPAVASRQVARDRQSIRR